jgi:hypothetical protein
VHYEIGDLHVRRRGRTCESGFELVVDPRVVKMNVGFLVDT